MRAVGSETSCSEQRRLATRFNFYPVFLSQNSQNSFLSEEPWMPKFPDLIYSDSGGLTWQHNKLCVGPAVDRGFQKFCHGTIQWRYCVLLPPQQQQRSPHIVKNCLRPRTGGSGYHRHEGLQRALGTCRHMPRCLVIPSPLPALATVVKTALGTCQHMRQ